MLRTVRSFRALPVALLVPVLLLAACGGGDDPSRDAGSDGSTTTVAGEGSSRCDVPADGDTTDTTTSDTASLQPDDAPQRGGTLHYGVGAETSGWDPTRDRWATAGLEVARSFFEPLATYDAEYEVVPYLAESIEPNDDFTVWTITTRDGVTFHDGTAFDAEAVKVNLDAHLASPLTSSAIAAVDSVEVVDERTVEVTMEAPWAHFADILTGQGGYMAAPSMLAAEDGKRHPVGTGPFELVEWIPDSELTVRAYDDYWQEGYPLLDEIVFTPLGDNSTRLASFDSGELDITATAVPSQIIDLQERAADGEVQLYLDRTGETLENFTLLNPNEPPFDDLRARQALAYATDKQLLIDTVHEGLFEPADGLFHAASRWCTDVEFPQYDPAAAAEVLADYEADNGPLEFDFAGTSSVEDVEIREALAAQWAEVGIEAHLVNLDAATSIVQVLSGDFQASNFSLFTAQNPDSDWHFMHSSTKPADGEIGLNIVGIDSPELDAALDAARQSPEPDVVQEQYAEVNRILADEIPMVFLWHSLTGLVAQPYVRDATTFTLPDGSPGLGLFGVQHPLHQIWLDQQ